MWRDPFSRELVDYFQESADALGNKRSASTFVLSCLASIFDNLVGRRRVTSVYFRYFGLVLALHRRKHERFTNDPEVYQLYRRVVDERPGLIHDYAARMTRLVVKILADGVRNKEYKIDDIDAAAEVVRDAVTVYVHPAMSKQMRSWDTDWSRR